MNTLRNLSRFVSALLVLSVTLLSLPMTAHGAMVGTQAVIAGEQAAIDRDQLNATLERADVQQRLVAMGVDLKQAKERVAALTDNEVRELNAKVGDLPAGGLDGLGVIVFVFLVLLVTDILGYTDVFPFVNKAPR